MSNWLDDFILSHSELESPINFWRWSALAALSAVVKDKVWLHRQIYDLYPNIYVMLHAESGMKKGPPVAAAKRLVSAVGNTKIISGRASIQGILKELGTARTEPGGKVVAHSTAFICSSELSSSIVEDPAATKILTDLYDRQYNVGEWRSLLKMETFNLKNPTVTMLTATNEAMGEEFFNKAELQGGYIARTFVIYEKQRNKINSLAYPLTHAPNYTLFAEYLKELAKLSGPFESLASLEKSEVHHIPEQIGDRTIFFSEAGYLYNKWYVEFQNQVQEQEIKDDTGTLNRFGDSVLKVAMLLSLARKPELIISGESMQEAISLCEKLVGGIRTATLGKKGISQSTQLKIMILNELINRENNQISRPMLMKKMWMHYSTEDEFNNIINSFIGAGLLQATHLPGSNIMMYYIPDKAAKEIKDYLAGKMGKKDGTQ